MDFWANLNHELQCDSVLELACGTGRLANIFLRVGANYSGIELNADFVKSAKNKIVQFGKRGTIHQGDMRSFSLNKKFDLIFIGFNSFLHLLTDQDAIDCLSCIKNHMHNDSRFVIDIYVPNPLFLYRPEKVRFPVLEYTDSTTNKYVYVSESNVYDSETEINKMTWFFSTKSEKDFDIRCFDVRMYFPSKMNQILIDAGFQILHQWGDYYRGNLGDGSTLQIYKVKLA